MTVPIQELQNKLWATADQLRANSELTSAEYKSPVLGLVFLRFADQKFSVAKEQDAKKASKKKAVKTLKEKRIAKKDKKAISFS